ncbi:MULTISPECIES: class I SAM-dependent methyltransferase [Stenotrophomonas]|uniref:class I SAM-dependent methyltransferase n=1 Tax=Stenotrophomonas TaxID=40323 RepID=UPI000D0E2876|nr:MULTISPECIES: class I SAM-dependent methyltransferase [Stenotrophomonas]PSM13437.1 class I SAM-dependent methyltransferase [Stenotrophomonas maltophilia]
MKSSQHPRVKKNVAQFDDDVRATGSYRYTTDRLSSNLANARISSAVAAAFPFQGKRVLDLGCGDGSYTLEFPGMGAAHALGVDPAAVAIEAAQARAATHGLASRVEFAVGNIYDIGAVLEEGRFDCIVLRGVLHHLPDPAGAIAGLAGFKGSIVVVEPNGLNPVLKLLERFSRYHIEHEERSFTPWAIRGWLRAAGFNSISTSTINLVPFFCPDAAARGLRVLEPLVEHLPIARDIACGQNVMLAQR